MHLHGTPGFSHEIQRDFQGDKNIHENDFPSESVAVRVMRRQWATVIDAKESNNKK